MCSKSRGATLKLPKRFGPKRVQKNPKWHKKPSTTDFVSAAFLARAVFSMPGSPDGFAQREDEG